jgi:hypothetical protein
MSDELQLVVSAPTRKLQLYLSPTYCHRIARQAEARRTLARIFAGNELVQKNKILQTCYAEEGAYPRSVQYLGSRAICITVTISISDS